MRETDESVPGDDGESRDQGGVPPIEGTSLGGVDRSIRPGVPVPETVLVFALNHGGYFLVGHPHGEPAAWVVAADAHLLDRALGDAFGSAPTEER